MWCPNRIWDCCMKVLQRSDEQYNFFFVYIHTLKFKYSKNGMSQIENSYIAEKNQWKLKIRIILISRNFFLTFLCCASSSNTLKRRNISVLFDAENYSLSMAHISDNVKPRLFFNAPHTYWDSADESIKLVLVT